VILADTSIWIDQFRSGNAALIALLDKGQIAMHLLAAVRLTTNARLWSGDRRLKECAVALKLDVSSP
jgi:predicted nucleic acid-binding protein